MKYFDIFIRLASTRIDFANPVDGTNMIENFDRLEEPDLKATFKLLPQITDLGDGTQGMDGERMEFSSGTFRCDANEWAYLRSTFHNKLCDVMLFDTQKKMILAVAYAIKLNVSHVTTLGESRLVKLDAVKHLGPAAVSAGAVQFLVDLLNVMDDAVIVSGTVYALDRVTPVPGVSIVLDIGDDHYDDTTDKDGRFIILANKVSAACSLTATKSGWAFSPDYSEIYPSYAQENIYDFISTMDGS